MQRPCNVISRPRGLHRFHIEESILALIDEGHDLSKVLFEQAPVGLAFLDTDLRYRALNTALATINGLPVAAHLGRSVEELWPDLDPRVVRSLRHAIRTGEPVVRLELEAVTPAAPEVRSFIHSYRPLFDDTGAVIGLNCSVVEVSELKAAEREVRRARDAAALLATLNGQLAAATTVAGVAQHVVSATQLAFGSLTAGLFLLEQDQFVVQAATGYSDEILASFGAWPLDAPSPARAAIDARDVQLHSRLEDLEGSFPVIASAMRTMTGERAVATTPLIVDGTPIGSLHLGFAEERRLSEEEVAGLRAVGDVTAQAIARIRLVEAERRGRQMLSASVEQMPLAVMIVDELGGLVHANQQAALIWEGPPPEADGGLAFDAFRGYHPGGGPYEPSEWPIARSLAAGEIVVDEEIAIDTFAGQRRIISASSAPIEGVDGHRIGAVSVFADVTARRESEKLRDAFLGMLSHELRTPVTSIFGAAHLLRARERTLSDEIRRSLTEDVEQASIVLLRLVENLLVLARAERGATRVEPAPVLLHHVVTRVAAQEARRWPTTRLSVSAPPSLPPVLADEALVELMITNLIANAAKYAPGDATIAVEPGTDTVSVCVSDHGPGIAEEELDAVFGLFHRSATTARNAPGSGIGLFVVRHLAESQGGHAWARNLAGGGLEVGFRMPLAGEDD